MSQTLATTRWTIILQAADPSAPGSQQALDLLATEVVDLVLMDCQMPIVDGFAATMGLREREAASGQHQQANSRARAPRASGTEPNSAGRIKVSFLAHV